MIAKAIIIVGRLFFRVCRFVFVSIVMLYKK